MTDKLEWNEDAMGLMEYIGLAEAILLPDLDDYEYPFNVFFCRSHERGSRKGKRIMCPFDSYTLHENL